MKFTEKAKRILIVSAACVVAAAAVCAVFGYTAYPPYTDTHTLTIAEEPRDIMTEYSGMEPLRELLRESTRLSFKIDIGTVFGSDAPAAEIALFGGDYTRAEAERLTEALGEKTGGAYRLLAMTTETGSAAPLVRMAVIIPLITLVCAFIYLLIRHKTAYAAVSVLSVLPAAALTLFAELFFDRFDDTFVTALFAVCVFSVSFTAFALDRYIDTKEDAALKTPEQRIAAARSALAVPSALCAGFVTLAGAALVIVGSACAMPGMAAPAVCFPAGALGSIATALFGSLRVFAEASVPRLKKESGESPAKKRRAKSGAVKKTPKK